MTNEIKKMTNARWYEKEKKKWHKRSKKNAWY